MDIDFNDLGKVLKAWYEEDGKKLPEPPNPETHPAEWKKFWAKMLEEKKKVIEDNHKENMNKLASLDYVVRTSSTDKISESSKQSDKKD